MMKLYRFRAIDTCESVERIEQTLTSDEFWCSRFWEMNDPMEGIYRLSQQSDRNIQELFTTKASQYICCFSDVYAIRNPAMWGYYANGFKGVAIEVEVDQNQVIQISYKNELHSPKSGNDADETAKEILSRKLKKWAHEREYRFLSNTGTNLQKIGKITKLIVGYTYPQMFNHPDVDHRWAKAEEYACRVKRLINVCQSRTIPVSRAKMKNGKVTINTLVPDKFFSNYGSHSAHSTSEHSLTPGR